MAQRRPWWIRGAAILAGALIGTGVGFALLAATEPHAEYANEEYRQGVKQGFVLRYVVLGALGGFAAHGLAGRIRRKNGGLGWPTVAYGLGLAAVLALMVIPTAVSGEGDDERRTRRSQSFKAGFVDGCSEEASRAYCECLYEQITREPGADEREIAAAFRQFQIDGRPSPEVRRAVAICRPRL